MAWPRVGIETVAVWITVIQGTEIALYAAAFDELAGLAVYGDPARAIHHSYIYDADGNLLIQKDPGTIRLYLPNEEIDLDTASNLITGTRFYDLPGGSQAVRTSSGAAYSYEVTDQHDTATLALDSTLTQPQWRQQTPYGAPRGDAPANWPDNHGFLNKSQDTSTGLTNVGARWYDPTLGRFTSLDPVFQATSQQEQNGYTYAASNPITEDDPTGMCPADVCGYGTPKPCAFWNRKGCGYIETGPVDPVDPAAGYYRNGHFEHGWWDYNARTHSYGGERLAQARAAAAYQQAQEIRRRILAQQEAARKRLNNANVNAHKSCHGFFGCAGHFLEHHAGDILTGAATIGAFIPVLAISTTVTPEIRGGSPHGYLLVAIMEAMTT